MLKGLKGGNGGKSKGSRPEADDTIKLQCEVKDLRNDVRHLISPVASKRSTSRRD